MDFEAFHEGYVARLSLIYKAFSIVAIIDSKRAILEAPGTGSSYRNHQESHMTSSSHNRLSCIPFFAFRFSSLSFDLNPSE